jgi:tRNA 2-thiocytidine biosynthesis protein TtcA
MFYGGKMKGMPPKLMSDDGKHIVIRPLAYCREKDIERFSQAKGFPIIPCNLCGSQPNLQRQVIADMLRDWDKRYPGRIETMFSAMQNVVPSHLSDTTCLTLKALTTAPRWLTAAIWRLTGKRSRCSLPAGSRKKMTPAG